ncbi:hypothetical protein MATL_G00034690 [Megalops atlanticus]|uniref:G-protein coupled receptors family 1 profile domain-containing protein n=1 Tax=Megalops atlanticus TaxID=7932 RepID=A0A9D3TCH5_MEGAT|nr:hypothetical protein MATL_G00034690 [Megalops atlanticus]
MFNNSSEEKSTVWYPEGSHLENVLFASFYTVIFIIAVPGNILALWVFTKEKRKNSPSKVFLKNLAVADVSFVMMLPMRIVYHLMDSHWPFGEILCRLLGYLFYLNMYCSLYFMTCISLDRFIAVVFPIQALRIRKPAYAGVASAILWFCLVIAMMPLLLSQQTVQLSDSNRTVCNQLYREKPSARALVSTAVAFAIPLITIVASYIMILHRLCRKMEQEKRPVREKAIRMIVLILVNFTVAFVPYHVTRFIYIEGSHHRGKTAVIHPNGATMYPRCGS